MSEMSNQDIKDDSVNGTGTASGESALSGRLGAPDQAPAGCHRATDQN